MKIQTTVNMNKMVMEELNHASCILKLSRTDIIRLLLKQFLDDKNNIQIFRSAVKYQDRDDQTNWSTFHLVLKEDEYELCLDLRKVYKMSLSFIIAFAVRKFMNRVIFLVKSKTLEELTDNYLFHNYYFSFNSKNGVRSIKIYWGITNLEEIVTDNYQNII